MNWKGPAESSLTLCFIRIIKSGIRSCDNWQAPIRVFFFLMEGIWIFSHNLWWWGHRIDLTLGPPNRNSKTYFCRYRCPYQVIKVLHWSLRTCGHRTIINVLFWSQGHNSSCHKTQKVSIINYVHSMWICHCSSHYVDFPRFILKVIENVFFDVLILFILQRCKTN